jgi:hypothetical protein
MIRVFLALAGWFILAGAPALADSRETPSAAELARILRTLVLPNLPNPLVEQSFNWGHQELVVVGVKWEKKGILLKPEFLKKLHNDGAWRKIAALADNPESTLQLDVKDVRVSEPGKLSFAVVVTLPVNLKFEQQIWHAGTRFYSGETRARCKAVLSLACESTSRFERQPGALLPDLVFRLRIPEARLNYYDLVVEHTAGVGGDAAKLIGEAVIDTVKQWKPSLERKLLEKANSAIVKAGDTKEVRLGLSKLLEDKK